MVLSFMKKNMSYMVFIFDFVNFPVFGSKLRSFWTIFTDFGDVIDENMCSTCQNVMKISGWILYGLETSTSMLNSKHYIQLGHNLIKTILHILSIYSFNSQKSQNLSYQKL